MQGASTRAWMIGAAAGVVCGIITAGSGFLTIIPCCGCLFQFANALIPGLGGALSGGLAAGMAPWAELEEGKSAPMEGALLGLRAGGLASILASGIGLLVSMGWPILSAVIAALTTDDVMGAIMSALLLLGMSLLWGAMFALAGAIGGTVLGVGAGAVAGVVLAPKR